MHRSLFATLSVGLALALLASVGAAPQDEQRDKKRPLAAAPGQLGGPLVPDAIKERLNLSAEQKEKIAKLESEFAAKAKDSEGKLQDLLKKAREDRDRAALKDAQDKIAEARKIREGYEAKVAEVLTPEQRRTYSQAGGAGKRPGGFGSPQLLPAPLVERLGLSEDQKGQLEKLQKDFETKALQILTEEQRQMLERFKKGRPKAD